MNENLENVIVKFEVEKIWFLDNGLDKNDLAVFKFDESAEKWNELKTDFNSEDDDFYYYVVELDSFSFFAIGEKVKEEVGGISEIVEETTGDIVKKKLKINLDILRNNGKAILILIVIFLIIIIGIYYKRRKQKEAWLKLERENLFRGVLDSNSENM